MLNFQKLVIITFFGVFFFLVTFMPAYSIWLYHEEAPVVYSSRKVLTPVVPPGGTLEVEIRAVFKKKTCIATVYRHIIDAAGEVTDFAPITRPAFEKYTLRLSVPKAASLGPAQYRADVHWVCNFVQAWFPKTVFQPEINFIIDGLPISKAPHKPYAVINE